MSTFLVSSHIYGLINYVKRPVDLISISGDLYGIIYCICNYDNEPRTWNFTTLLLVQTKR
jgi:hypothetical protein